MKMPCRNRLSVIACTCLLLLSACEKVIDVDLNAAAPKFVIEGVVADGPGPHQVRVTQTKDFDENNNFDGVAAAEVTIADDAGNTETLAYTGGGVYAASALVGTPGRKYTLTVRVGAETFTAAAVMPRPVAIDSVYTETFTTFGDPVIMPYASFSDPSGTRNFYRHLLYVNQVRVKNIYVNTDVRSDGFRIERALPLFGPGEGEELKAGDTVTVEMQVIGEAVYDYFFSLEQTIGQSAATPANPVSNISGGALGYFSAHSADSKSIVVK
jgi:hypothetical protein